MSTTLDLERTNRNLHGQVPVHLQVLQNRADIDNDLAKLAKHPGDDLPGPKMLAISEDMAIFSTFVEAKVYKSHGHLVSSCCISDL